MNRRIIAQEWKRYRDQVVPKNALRVQHVEMERAFHAGALSLLSTVMKILAPDEEVTADDEILMNDVYEELEEFFGRTMADGKVTT